MIRVLDDMPPGTVGVEAVGKVTADDYRDVLGPVVQDALARKDVRLLYVLGKEFDSYAPSAAWEDTKLWAGHLKGWKKVAVVSDADWLEHSVKAFAWLVPGDIKVFETDEVQEAKRWLVDLDDDDDDDDDD
ncbi:MAG: STAS/SEC14 domain-containing protein [Nocardioidaceae bacterium]|nr:STAS/SEC14 domain-containing protein [Nocardioidaceae bacterium]NUS50361.1 STAS/SEC14 domain-containing protein [Nocardioidaceae bacterium]